MKVCDLHIHSNNSFDAKNSVDEICQAAIAKNLYAVAITDHCETPDIKLKEKSKFGYFDKLIPQSVKDVEIAKERYSQNLKVLCGIELGEPMHDPNCTEIALNYGKFDFILASVHSLRNMEDMYYIDFTAVNIDEILRKYFDELLETAHFEHFDSLAHLIYPLRYIKEKTGETVDLAPYQNTIDDIYKVLIKNKKALEINVSGLYKDLGTTLPDEAQIKRFRELGGEYVTIGTDSHCSEDVGKGIEQGIALAKKCGFKQYTIFENHKPILIDID